MLPNTYETPYKVSSKNGVLEKGVRYYMKIIAEVNKRFLGEDQDKSLLVDSIFGFLSQLPFYGYYAYFVEAKSLGGLATEVKLVIEDRNDKRSVIQTEVTLVSENQEDYVKYILGKIR